MHLAKGYTSMSGAQNVSSNEHNNDCDQFLGKVLFGQAFFGNMWEEDGEEGAVKENEERLEAVER